MIINASAVRDLLEERPFRPFQIRLANGDHYEITHPQFAWVTTSTVEVGLQPNEDGIVSRIARCALINITSVNDLPEPVKEKA